MSNQKMKFISDIDTGENVISVKKPFKLIKDQKRRFIRLEISAPLQYLVLKDCSEGFWPNSDGPGYDGEILNLSAGGVLVLANAPIESGAIVLMKMSLQDIDVIDNVIGLVKRTEDSENEWLIGIEFVSREYLNDVFSRSEIDLLPNDMASFDERLRKVLNKYIYYRRVSKESK